MQGADRVTHQGPLGAGLEVPELVPELDREVTQLKSETLRSQGEREQEPQAGQPQVRGLGQEQEFQEGHTGTCWLQDR